MKAIAASAAALLAIGLLAGCGGGGGDSTETGHPAGQPGSAGTTAQESGEADPGGAGKGEGNAGAEPRQPRTPDAYRGAPHHDAQSGVAQFETEGGDNSLQHFGSEATSREFDEAAAALHRYLDARAAEEWGPACSLIAPRVVETLVRFSSRSRPVACPELLAAASGGVPAASRRQAAVANVAALRLKNGRGFLFFHGAQGISYVIPMVSEGGDWYVAALAPSALP